MIHLLIGPTHSLAPPVQLPHLKQLDPALIQFDSNVALVWFIHLLNVLGHLWQGMEGKG